MVSFTPQLLYPEGKSECYPLNMGLGGPELVLFAPARN